MSLIKWELYLTYKIITLLQSKRSQRILRVLLYVNKALKANLTKFTDFCNKKQFRKLENA